MAIETQIQNLKDSTFFKDRNSASFTFEALTIVTVFIKHRLRAWFEELKQKWILNHF